MPMLNLYVTNAVLDAYVGTPHRQVARLSTGIGSQGSVAFRLLLIFFSRLVTACCCWVLDCAWQPSLGQPAARTQWQRHQSCPQYGVGFTDDKSCRVDVIAALSNMCKLVNHVRGMSWSAQAESCPAALSRFRYQQRVPIWESSLQAAAQARSLDITVLLSEYWTVLGSQLLVSQRLGQSGNDINVARSMIWMLKR